MSTQHRDQADLFTKLDRDLSTGIFELKEDFGPGYRIYFGIDGDEIIVLLVGGDKKSQDKDIAKAKEYWTDYLWRKQK